MSVNCLVLNTLTETLSLRECGRCFGSVLDAMVRDSRLRLERITLRKQSDSFFSCINVHESTMEPAALQS